MRNKEIENRILNSLEDKSAGLDPRVLDAVKSEIGEQKKTKRSKNVLRFAVAALIVAALCLAVALPITLIKSPSEGYTENGFTSMNEYFSEHGIPLKSLKEIMDDGSLAGTGQNNGLEKSECTLISNGKGEDVIIEETYTFIGGDVVTIALMLSDAEEVKQKFYSDYADLSAVADIAGVSVNYVFDDASESGKAKFNYNGYAFYASFDVQGEESMMSIIRFFLRFNQI